MPELLPKHCKTARKKQQFTLIVYGCLGSLSQKWLAKGKKNHNPKDAHYFCTLVKSKYRKSNSDKYIECLFTLDPDSPEVSVSHNHSTAIKVNNLTTTLS